MSSKKASRRVVILGDTDFFMVPLSDIVSGAGMKPVVCPDLEVARAAMAEWTKAPLAIVVNLSTLAFDGREFVEDLARDRESGSEMLLVCIDHVFERTDPTWLTDHGVDLVVHKGTTPAVLAAQLRSLVFGVEDREENRKGPRVATCFPVEFADGERIASGYCVSLSAGGMFVQTGHPVALDASIRVRFALEQLPELIDAQGRVVYTSRRDERASGPGPRGTPGMGLEFVDLAPQARAAIDARLGPALAEVLPSRRGRTRRKGPRAS